MPTSPKHTNAVKNPGGVTLPCPECGGSNRVVKSATPHQDVVVIGLRCADCGSVGEEIRPGSAGLDWMSGRD